MISFNASVVVVKLYTCHMWGDWIVCAYMYIVWCVCVCVVLYMYVYSVGNILMYCLSVCLSGVCVLCLCRCACVCSISDMYSHTHRPTIVNLYNLIIIFTKIIYYKFIRIRNNWLSWDAKGRSDFRGIPREVSLYCN